jgi:hypothetical protein
MKQHLPLETVAAATGQSVDWLRAWCATGNLRCEKDGDGWTLPIVELVRVGALVAQRDASFAAGHAQAFVAPIASASPGLRAEVARRLGLPAAAVTTSTLALDGTAYVLALWNVNGADEAHELASLMELAEELGGQLLDGEVNRSDRASRGTLVEDGVHSALDAQVARQAPVVERDAGDGRWITIRSMNAASMASRG